MASKRKSDHEGYGYLNDALQHIAHGDYGLAINKLKSYRFYREHGGVEPGMEWLGNPESGDDFEKRIIDMLPDDEVDYSE